MKQFIPAWYDSKNWWKSTVEPFYIKRKVTEFDDMISLISMHQKNSEAFNTLILNYQPMLRLFLHRHDIYETSYWSLFDDIQGARQITPHAIDYRDLAWPEDTEFIYTSFQVIARTEAHKYSKIQFSQEGYLVVIEEYVHEKLQKKYIFDDRGFISSIETFQSEDIPNYKKYLNIEGDVVMTQNLITQEIEIDQAFYSYFQKKSYAHIDELIYEKLEYYYTNYLKDTDKVIVAADQHHNHIINKVFSSDNICFSVFTQRNRLIDDKMLNTITMGHYCVVDTLENEKKIKNFIEKNEQFASFDLMRITPFDVQSLSNISGQLYETNIGVWIDGLSEDKLKQLLPQLLQYSLQRENVRLHLLTREDFNATSEWLTNEISNINKQLNERNNPLSLEVRDVLETEIKETEYIKLIFVPFEEDLIKAISRLRIVIDMSNEPDLYLQISSISAGIPQINQRDTEYVDHKLNGLIINGIFELNGALDFYILNLKNWNYAFAHSIKLGKVFSSSKIIQQLNQLIEGESHGT